MKLLLATRNRAKLAELRSLLEGTGWQLVTLNDYPALGPVAETGATFEENARLKAVAAFQATGLWTLGEDSGLEVDALGGEPGVMSARWAGPEATDHDRCRQLLARMIAVPDELRTARFRCVVCLVEPSGAERFFEGVCPGRISHHIRGSAGFGYDPLFIPDGYSLTFAQLGNAVKSRISHRAQAIQRLAAFLRRHTARLTDSAEKIN